MQHLLRTAINVMLSRLRGIIEPSGSMNSSLLRSFAVTEHMHQPRIEITAQVQHQSSADSTSANTPISYLGTRISRIGQTLDHSEIPGNPFSGYDAAKWPVPSPYSHTIALSQWAHYWQDPCSDQHGMPVPFFYAPESTVPPTRSPSDDMVESTFHPPTGPLPPLAPTSSSEPAAAIYTHYAVECDYEVDATTISLPIAAWEGTGNATDTLNSLFVSTSRQQAAKVVHIHAERTGGWPLLPYPKPFFYDTNGINYALAWVKYYPTTPWLMPDGRTKLYRMQMRCKYFMSRAPVITDQLRIGYDPRILPADTDVIFNLSTVLSPDLNTL
jgi:hypothetical protein